MPTVAPAGRGQQPGRMQSHATADRLTDKMTRFATRAEFDLARVRLAYGERLRCATHSPPSANDASGL